MRDHHFAFPQIMPSHRDAFIEQSAGILAQIQNQTSDVGFTQLIELVFHLLAGIFVERGDMHVGDAGAEPERLFHAQAGNFVADDVEA